MKTVPRILSKCEYIDVRTKIDCYYSEITKKIKYQKFVEIQDIKYPKVH